MTPENHDAAFAAVSHLPHLLAFAYFSAWSTSRWARTTCRWPAPAFATSRASRPVPRDVARHPGGQPRRGAQAVQALPPRAGRAGARDARRQCRRTGRPDPRPGRRPRGLADGRAPRAGLTRPARTAGPTLSSRLCMFQIPLLDLPPLRGAAGTVRLPGSKSISNRVLLLAGLAEGTTVVHDLLDSDDTRVMLDALRALGCGLSATALGAARHGPGRPLAVQKADLFLGNAGTAMRPLTAALACWPPRRAALHAVGRAAHARAADRRPGRRTAPAGLRHRRPAAGLPAAARHGQAAAGWPPAPDPRARRRVQPVPDRAAAGAAAGGADRPGDHRGRRRADLQALHRHHAEAAGALRHRGAARRLERFTIPQGSRYRTPGAIHVEGDASSASYFVALGAIAATATRRCASKAWAATPSRATSASSRPRRPWAPGHVRSRLARGARGRWPLPRIDLDCNHIPDAAMTLAVMALYADGTTRLTGIASWRVKETDRIAAMAAELRKLGATVVEGGLHRGDAAAALAARSIHTYDDHRMAMCLSLAAFNPLAVRCPCPAAHPRPALRGQDLPRLLRSPVRRGQADPTLRCR
jgi:3-phosphoshikimate 1-carboxyvinyltransferase